MGRLVGDGDGHPGRTCWRTRLPPRGGALTSGCLFHVEHRRCAPVRSCRPCVRRFWHHSPSESRSVRGAHVAPHFLAAARDFLAATYALKMAVVGGPTEVPAHAPRAGPLGGGSRASPRATRCSRDRSRPACVRAAWRRLAQVDVELLAGARPRAGAGLSRGPVDRSSSLDRTRRHLRARRLPLEPTHVPISRGLGSSGHRDARGELGQTAVGRFRHARRRGGAVPPAARSPDRPAGSAVAPWRLHRATRCPRCLHRHRRVGSADASRTARPASPIGAVRDLSVLVDEDAIPR